MVNCIDQNHHRNDYPDQLQSPSESFFGAVFGVATHSQRVFGAQVKGMETDSPQRSLSFQNYDKYV